MPPRIPMALRLKPSRRALALPTITTTLPLRPRAPITPISLRQISTTPSRHEAHILGSLSDVPASYNNRVRRGRGPASGKGKTAGRGASGQKKHGKVPRGFQGGQTPIEKSHGTRGFKNQRTLSLTPLNISRLSTWIQSGRIDPSRLITIRELSKSRCATCIKDGVKLLANDADSLSTPIHIVVSRASAAAIAAIERAGGSVTTRYYTSGAVKRVLRGDSHPVLSMLARPEGLGATLDTEGAVVEGTAGERSHAMPALMLASESYPGPEAYRYRLPDATSRKDLEYYRDPAKRGYLCWQVAEGDGPSLFFKTPRNVAAAAGNAIRKKGGGKAGAAAKGENKIW